MKYHTDFYNKVDNTEQWIRLSDGCYRNCWFCSAPQHKISYKFPDIIRNKVRFLDMNFLYSYPNPEKLLSSLFKIKVNKKIVRYSFICGLDFTLINSNIIHLCKKSRIGRFNNKGNWINGLTIAWDRGLNEADQVKKAVLLIEKGGYLKKNIACFMLCNGKISFKECVAKLKVLKNLKIQIQDCWFNNQKRGQIIPSYWTLKQCVLFGQYCRAHNIAVIQNMYNSLNDLFNL